MAKEETETEGEQECARKSSLKGIWYRLDPLF
jgi:hypothetical protein